MTMGNTIAVQRKQLGITQEGLAQLLGVTNQAVSKWESDQCYPDIMLLPKLADIFEITVDVLFGREPQKEPETWINGLPWPDDETLRGVVYIGQRLVGHSVSGLGRKIRYQGAVKQAVCDFCMECGNVDGDVNAGSSVTCKDVGGDVNAGGSITCGNVDGDVSVGGSITCGNIGGDVDAGSSITCQEIGGDADAGTSISCTGIRGSAGAGSDVVCGNVGGDVDAGGYVKCYDIGGDVDAGGYVQCARIGGSVEAGS